MGFVDYLRMLLGWHSEPPQATIDYDVDESDVFRARQRGTRFDARRTTLAMGRKRPTLARADTSKAERA